MLLRLSHPLQRLPQKADIPWELELRFRTVHPRCTEKDRFQIYVYSKQKIEIFRILVIIHIQNELML